MCALFPVTGDRQLLLVLDGLDEAGRWTTGVFCVSYGALRDQLHQTLKRRKKMEIHGILCEATGFRGRSLIGCKHGCSVLAGICVFGA